MPNVIDPVCGMTVDSATAIGTSSWEGKQYYFCSVGCKSEFDAQPAEYATPLATEEAVIEDVSRPDILLDDAAAAAQDLTSLVEQNARRHLADPVVPKDAAEGRSSSRH